MEHEFSHIPVLLEECMEGLRIQPDGIYADGTAGGGGHSHRIGECLSAKGHLISVDRDPDAIRVCRERLSDLSCKVTLLHTDFASLPQYLKEQGILLNGLLLDLGVSSYQLDTPERGFSYMASGELDMRMDPSATLTAKDVVNGYPVEKLTKIFTEYGEERYAARIARAIGVARSKKEISTTSELTELIRHAMPPQALREKQHPAKRVFQAIRIEVNDELGEVSRLLETIPEYLAPQGRIAVITFHSLEDRLVKRAFAGLENPCTCPPDFPVCVCGKIPQGKALKPVEPSAREIEENPRARSARLRIFVKK